MKKYLSITDMIVIIVTALLFLIALFVNGISKELLLEVGILLVSIKLILMNHKNARANEKILEELVQLKKRISKTDNTNSEE
jgi:hypothetical protein